MQIEGFDSSLRRHVYATSMQRGTPPATAELARLMDTTPAAVRAGLGRLAAGRVLVLTEETGEILMAPPFSAVPTLFLVEAGGISDFGSCIWDALGIAAMLRRDAVVRTSFRSEEHIDPWCERWRLPRGGLLSLENGWRLARAWFGPDRRELSWRRHTPAQAKALFAELGLTSSFWSL